MSLCCFRGAMARAYLASALLALVCLLVVAPRAEAFGWAAPPWPAIPGDAYRGGRGGGLFAAPRGGSRHHPGLPLARDAVAALVAGKAATIGVPVRLALAIARFESGFRMGVRGGAGERGAMQVLPQTARQVGVRGNLFGPPGIEAGVRYLRLAMALHGRAGWCAVASAYNAGVWHSSRCTRYGRRIVAMAARQ